MGQSSKRKLIWITPWAPLKMSWMLSWKEARKVCQIPAFSIFTGFSLLWLLWLIASQIHPKNNDDSINHNGDHRNNRVQHMAVRAHLPKESWSTQQHRVSKEIHEFFKWQHSQSTGRRLASPVMHQIRPQHPPPSPQASEADSRLMGGPFSHSVLGSQPRDKLASACLSNMAKYGPITSFPISNQRGSELPGSWQQLQDLLDSPHSRQAEGSSHSPLHRLGI